jgi:F-type H+-transporting ATPase subunit a
VSSIRILATAALVTAFMLGGAAFAESPAHGGGALTAEAEHDAGHAAAGHGSAKTRPEAPEDKHWWLGQEIFPVSLRDKVASLIGPSIVDKDGPAKLNVAHVFFGVLVFIIGILLALAARKKVVGTVLPPKSFGAAAFFDVILEAILSLMTSMMPRDKALRFLPVVTATAVFILLSNLLGLVPGFVPPTQSLNTTLALGLTAFVYFTYQGIRTQGVIGFFKHFMGPILVLAPLMFVVEMIAYRVGRCHWRCASWVCSVTTRCCSSHDFRLPLIPLPLMALGLMVCVVQTVVFATLHRVLSLAVEEHDHDEEHAEPAADGFTRTPIESFCF